MFQRALPEVEGFGVITSTPGLIRSSQPVMCLGLPLRTTSTTTESVTIPLCGLAFQVAGDDPVLDQPRDVGRGRECDHVGRLARVDGAALGARGAEGLGEPTPLPAGVCANAGDRACRRRSAASSTPPARVSSAAARGRRACARARGARRVRRPAAAGERRAGDQAGPRRPRRAASLVVVSWAPLSTIGWSILDPVLELTV